MNFKTRFFTAGLVLLSFAGITKCLAQKVEYKHPFNPAQGLVYEDEKSFRDEICLNGKWKFMPVYEGKAADFKCPTNFKWEETDIKIPSPWNVNAFTDGQGGDFNAYPSYPQKWTRARIGWMKKTIDVPADWKDKSLFLHFEGILGKAQVFVNNKLVAENFELFLPLDVDVTPFLKPGEKNEILVGVAKSNIFDVQGKYGRRTNVGGSMWGIEMAGIWQDVYLFAYPQVFVKDIFVQPDVQKNNLKLVVEINNSTSQKKEITVSGAIRRWFNLAGRTLNEMPEQKGLFENQAKIDFTAKKISVAPQSVTQVIIEQPVDAKLDLWTPESPNLYGAQISLSDKKTTFDKKIERFGWRQFTADGNKLLLNGKEIHLKGDSWHFMGVPQMTRRYAWAWYNMLKDANGNAVRLHAQPFPRLYLDMADEMGICVLDETGLWASDGGPKIDNEQYWLSCREHLQKLILRDKNHPSVFGWSVCNENIPVAVHVFKAPKELVKRQVDELNEWVRIAQKMDPTRIWISGDGETDTPTILPTVVGHYGDANSLHHWASQGKPWGVGETSMAYYGTPKQVSKINGNRAYESMLGRMEGLAQECYDLIKMQRAENASYSSVFNLIWYSLQPLPLGQSDVTRAATPEDGIFFGFEEGKPGMQPERLGPYTSTLNPGYDANLPIYRTWPMFDAIKAANSETIQPFNSVKPQPKSAKFKIETADFTHIFGNKSSTLFKDFEQMGLTVNNKEKLTSRSLIIIDGKCPPVDVKSLSEIKSGMELGAKVLVWGVTPESLDALNAFLPYKLELCERKATSFLKEKDVPMLQGLNHADFYFSELLPKGKTAMSYGLCGDFAFKAQTILTACGTEWQRWNYQAETTKTANVYRSELETKGSRVAIAHLSWKKSEIIVSTVDCENIKQESDVIVRIMLSNLGAQFNTSNTAKMKALDEKGNLQTSLICGAFNTDSKTTAEMLDFNFVENENELNPQLGTLTEDKHWVLVNAGKNNEIDIRNAQLSGSNENAAVYLSFWLFSPRSLVNLLAEPDMPKLDMQIGAEKGFCLYVNGNRFANKATESYVPYGSKVENIPLDKGWNHLILKIVRGTGEGRWNANVQFQSNSSEYMKQLLSSVAR